MTILITACEVGSVRSLIPVCIELLNNGNTILIEKEGYFKVELIKELVPFFIDLPKSENSLSEFMIQESISSILFSVNVHDTRPLKIARVAQSLGIETIHLLDYWNGYRSRMELDGQRMFVPSKYLVPDEYAKKRAIEEGIQSDIISVVGQPAFSDAKFSFQEKRQQNILVDKVLKKNQKVILFVSEPVADDQGRSLEENKNYRGYTEKDALKILVKALKKSNDDFFVIVLPHPRQDIRKLKLVWKSLHGNSHGCVLPNVRGRELLPFVVGVSGMASTLLYEAWLVGVPVLSIQPGVLHESYRMMQKKDNTIFIDKYEFSVQMTEAWLKSLNSKIECILQSDLYSHVNASKTIVKKLNL